MARTKAKVQTFINQNRNMNNKMVTKDTSDDKKTPPSRKKYRKKPGTGAKQEIRKLQKSTKHLIPVAALERVIREVAQGVSLDNVLFSKDALLALRLASENYVVELMQIGTVMTGHARRDTLTSEDLNLSSTILNTIYKATSE